MSSEVKTTVTVELSLMQLASLNRANKLAKHIQKLYKEGELLRIDVDTLYNQLDCFAINLDFVDGLTTKVKNDLKTLSDMF